MDDNLLMLHAYTVVGIDFAAPDPSNMRIMLSNSTTRNCVKIMTKFDDHSSNMDKQFQVLLPASAKSDPVIYMPNTTNITITNCMCTIILLRELVY